MNAPHTQSRTVRAHYKAVITVELARAAAWDAGNQAMLAAGRTAWNEDDYNAACELFTRLVGAAKCITF